MDFLVTALKGRHNLKSDVYFALSGLGHDGTFLTQAFGLGFIISPLWGSKDCQPTTSEK